MTTLAMTTLAMTTAWPDRLVAAARSCRGPVGGVRGQHAVCETRYRSGIVIFIGDSDLAGRRGICHKQLFMELDDD
jgi:hypothetical protein